MLNVLDSIDAGNAAADLLELLRAEPLPARAPAAWAAVGQLAAAAEALLRLAPKLQCMLPLLTDARMLHPGGRTAADIEACSRGIGLHSAQQLVDCMVRFSSLMSSQTGRFEPAAAHQPAAAQAWPAVRGLAATLAKIALLSTEQAPAQPAAALQLPPHADLLAWLVATQALAIHCMAAMQPSPALFK